MHTVQPKKMLIINILEILRQHSDAEHPLNQKDIMDLLQSEYQMTVDRKAVKRNLMYLLDFGYNLEYTETVRTNKKGEQEVLYSDWYLERDFTDAELRLLIDSLLFSKHIPYSQCKELIGKLEQLCSIHEEKQLKRQVYVLNRIKTENEQVFYNVDMIHGAIHNNKQISFQYYVWSTTKEMKLRRSGQRYIVSPLGLTWDDENYYLIAFEEEKKEIRHYRVDKMKSIEFMDNERTKDSGYRNFDIASYGNKMFGMYGGSLETITLSFPEQLIGVMIDRFGKGITLKKESDTRYCVRVDVVVSGQFFGWVAGLGKEVKILAPDAIKEQYRQFLTEIIEQI